MVPSVPGCQSRWANVRVAICDDEQALVALVEELVLARGHEVLGIADNTVDAVHLVEHGHPDLLIVDPSVGCSSDFDVIETACTVGATTIAFTRNADIITVKPYAMTPIVIPKPDLVALDDTIGRTVVVEDDAAIADRRQRPAREAAGEPPTGPHDAAAFYGALTDAITGDGMLAIIDEAPDADVATRLMKLVRHGDRVAITGWAIVALLPAGGDDAIAALTDRMRGAGLVGDRERIASAVVADGESGPEAFARMRAASAEPAA